MAYVKKRFCIFVIICITNICIFVYIFRSMIKHIYRFQINHLFSNNPAKSLIIDIPHYKSGKMER